MSHAAPDIQTGRARRAARRSLIVPTLFALAAFGILIALGVWQLQRRDWKNDLIARFEQALAKPPVPYEPPQPNANEQRREFTRVAVTAAFEEAKTVKILVPAPEDLRAQRQDAFGYLLFTPLKIGDAVVFVNCGFAPQNLENAAEGPAGQATVTGILRLSQPPNWFTPAPDFVKRLFFSADVPEMAKAAELAGTGTVTGEYIEAEPSPQAGDWPKPRDPHELVASIPNRHLEYALTWFGLAAALLGVYGFFIARN